MTNDSLRTKRILHWAGALLIGGLLASGIYMSDGNDYRVYDWHKSFGVLALGYMLIRWVYHVKQPWQSSAAGTKLAKPIKLFHLSLMIGALILPLSGLAYSGLGGYGVDVFGWNLIAPNLDSAGQALKINVWGHDMGKLIHYYLGYLFTFMVIMHLVAALKHHFVDRDETLTKMMG